MNTVISWDHYWFKIINYKCQNSFFDWLMPWLRNSTMWAPLYLFLLIFFIYNFKEKAFWYIVYLVITVTLTDFVSSKLIKNYFVRVRPCNLPQFQEWVRVLVGSVPHNGSFTSSHAANHFGVATFLYITLHKIFGKKVALFFVWAFSISFAQIYVGVHFPLDIIGGSLVGISIGYLCAKQFNNNFMLN